VGFLFTGILAGPHGLGLISGVHQVEIFAEIGVVLLLFTIGIEFSLKNLLLIKKAVFLGGSLQVLLTIIAAFLLTRSLHLSVVESIFVGFVVSLSSTAIVLKILQERAEVESPHGRTALAILIFQDLAVVPMMLIVPFLAGKAGQGEESLFLLLAKGVGIIIITAVSAKWLVPQGLYQIARTRSRELFLLSVLVICFAVAWLTHSLGLSLALGAFLAGLIISESEYSQHTLGNIIPFRDVFTSLFFVSIGMLLNLGFLVNQPEQVALIAVIIIVLKSLIICLTVAVLGLPLRTAIIVGLSLCQVGEFSFILAKTGLDHGLLTSDFYQLFLAVSVLTMGATPFIMTSAHQIAGVALRLPLPGKLKTGFSPLPRAPGSSHKEYRDHLIIIGFGLNGQNVVHAAKTAGVSYIIVDMNPETVRKKRAEGEPIFYGDATQEAVLDHAGVMNARVMVVVISDPVATRQITAASRRLNPKLYIIARTRFFQEMVPLSELGANEVIPEEFETSVEIFVRVLGRYLIPRDEIQRFVDEARAGGYKMFRSLSDKTAPLCDLQLHVPDLEISTIRASQGSRFVGKSLAEIELRKKFGVTILAIKRGSNILSDIESTTNILADDLLIIMGSPGKLAAVIEQFHHTGGEAGEKITA